MPLYFIFTCIHLYVWLSVDIYRTPMHILITKFHSEHPRLSYYIDILTRKSGVIFTYSHINVNTFTKYTLSVE